jgi:hypothetical protein
MRGKYEGKNWLGDRDSNPDRQIQNLQSYHWTISQRGLIYISIGPPGLHLSPQGRIIRESLHPLERNKR